MTRPGRVERKLSHTAAQRLASAFQADGAGSSPAGRAIRFTAVEFLAHPSFDIPELLLQSSSVAERAGALLGALPHRVFKPTERHVEVRGGVLEVGVPEHRLQVVKRPAALNKTGPLLSPNMLAR